MSNFTSRQARSARREALKSKLETYMGSKSLRQPVDGKVSKASGKSKPDSKCLREAVELSAADNKPELVEEPQQPNQADIPIESEDESEFELDTSGLDSDNDETPSQVPEVVPEPKVEPIPETNDTNTTEDELQAFLREFEQNSFGHTDISIIPDTIEVPLQITPLEIKAPAPAPEATYEEEIEFTPDLDASTSSPVSEEEPEEIGIDDYINYTNDTETEPMDEDLLGKLNKKRNLACFYGMQTHVTPVHSSFNPNKRTLLAAWRTMAPDYTTGSREAYMHSILLAAASLNQRSMISGGARQTISPGISTL